MEVCGSPTVCSKARSSSIVKGFFADPRRIEFCSSAVSAVLGIFFYAILIFFFKVVGMTLGAMAGVLIGEDDGRTMDGSMVVASVGDCEVVLVVCREWRRRFRGFDPPFYNSRS
ncbi:hypothetical protein U1Q18_009972 [Sarracenia purpurea var. burkii]